jgi:ribosomal protein S18 acetylase RimI-like enzyme
MTASADLQTRDSQVVDMRNLTASDLEPLLLEEAAEWGRRLDWDFSKFADLVRRFADARMLNGAALIHRGEVAGYGHTCLTQNKGVITDLYVRSAWRTNNAEASLFRALLHRLIRSPRVRRVEAQLMLLDAETVVDVRREHGGCIFERLLMTLDVDTPLPPGRSCPHHRIRFEPWVDSHHNAAAALAFQAHTDSGVGKTGHIDNQINDQYRTLDGADRLLRDIVQFPGFYPRASYTAFDIDTQSAAGMLLSSFVADDAAQITELCVTPDFRGFGLGYELLRQSVAALRNAGAKRISLTVTAANREAMKLYARCGFRTSHRFHAYVWESLYS